MVRLTVQGMTCGGCAAAVRRAVGAVPGVSDVRVDLASRAVEVDGTPDIGAVRAAIAAAGFAIDGAAP